MNGELRRRIYLSHRYGGTQRLVNRLEHRLVASLLRRVPRPRRILDIPSGYGRFTPQLEDAAATPLVCSDVDHRRLAVLGPREFKRLLQTLGCRVLADRAILPGLHAQRVALVEKVNSSEAAAGNFVLPTPLDPSPGAIAAPGQPGVAPTVARPAPPSAVWVGVVALLLHLTSGGPGGGGPLVARGSDGTASRLSDCGASRQGLPARDLLVQVSQPALKVKAKACIAALVGARAAAPPAPDAVPRDLHAGVRVRLQATMTRPRTVVAEGVEIVAAAEGEDGLKAVIETVDPEAKTLTALGIKIVASDATVLRGESHGRVSFSAIRPGQRVSAKGTFRGDATLVASKLRIRPEKPEKARDVTLEGPVQQVDSGSTSFAVLGVTVMLTPQTRIERGGRGGKGLAGRAVTGAPRGEAAPSIPSYGVIWEERLTRSGAPKDEAGWTWLRNHGVRSVVNFRNLPEDKEASERARFEHYLSLPFEGKEPPTDAEAETFLAFVRDPHHWPVHIHCKEGRYRTGLMAALVRYAIDGWSIDDALAEARRYTRGKDLPARDVNWLRRWAADHERGSHALCV